MILKISEIIVQKVDKIIKLKFLKVGGILDVKALILLQVHVKCCYVLVLVIDLLGHINKILKDYINSTYFL